jgi:hypothetical protein
MHHPALPVGFQEIAVGDTPAPTDPSSLGSDASDVVEPLDRAVAPGRIISGANLALGTDSGLSTPVRR